MPDPRRVLLISGSLRGHSTNSAVLRTAQALAEPPVNAILYDGLAALPHFNPDDDHEPLPPAVASLRSQVHAADALLFSTPEYAGALPGSFKNLLDWLIGDDQPRSLYEKPVAWINVSSRAAEHAHASLHLVLRYAGAVVVDAACVHVPVLAADIGGDGLVAGAELQTRITDAVNVLGAATS